MININTVRSKDKYGNNDDLIFYFNNQKPFYKNKIHGYHIWNYVFDDRSMLFKANLAYNRVPAYDYVYCWFNHDTKKTLIALENDLKGVAKALARLNCLLCLNFFGFLPLAALILINTFSERVIFYLYFLK